MIMRMRGDLVPFGYPDEPVRIASCRDFNTNLSDSVKVAVEKYVRIRGLDAEFDCQAHKIVHRPSGSVMTFHGVNRNPDSFLSMDDIDIFWMEQAESLQDEMVKIAPTIRKPGSELWFVWNPHLRTDYCWRRFVLQPRPNDVSVHVNFDSNPWWTAELEEERYYDEINEPSLYPWVWLGTPNDGDATHQILPYEIVSKCVEAWPMRPEVGSSVLCDFGFDIAEGGRDKCATVGRIGPCVVHLNTWPGVAGDPDPAARRAHANTEGYTVSRMYYDAASPMRGPLQRLQPPYSVRAIGFGAEVGGKDVSYERGRTNGQVFMRRNIQLAQALRLRATRTVQLLAGKDVDPLHCLFLDPSLPGLEQFKAELTRPVRRISPTTGKWEMDKRGMDGDGESPDSFDALCLAFARDSDHGLRARL